MKATNIRKGNILRIDGKLYRVMNMDHVTPGKGRAHVQTKLRKMEDNTQTEMRFRSTDDLEKVALENSEMQFLYSDADGYHFMDTDTYNQIHLSADDLGDAAQYLLPDTVVQIQSFEGRALGVELPPSVEMRVVETTPGIKDSTASAQRKPATLETGLIVQVPSFVEEGEMIRVSTIDGTYSERVK